MRDILSTVSVHIQEHSSLLFLSFPSLPPLYIFCLHHLLPMKTPITPDTYIYSHSPPSIHPFIHDPATNSTSGWLAEHGYSRSCSSSPIRRLCRSNYVSVVHKPVATCYLSSLDSHFPWHDPLPLLLFKREAGGGGSSSVRVQLWLWL